MRIDRGRRCGRRRGRASERRAQRGFAYVALLVAVAVIGLVAASAVQLGAAMQRRAAEDALLVIGAEFGAALDSYAKATPAGAPTAPPTLHDLLRDPRYPGVRRHLRRIPSDPLTGAPTWGLVMAPGGQGIVGVRSLSTARPIKVANFPPAFRGFEGRRSYADWVFMPPVASAIAPAASGAASAP